MSDSDLRAIALALAFTNGLQTEKMFVGDQRAAFLQKVRRQADGDTYLASALYLLSEGTSNSAQIRETLLTNSYSKTEELLFVLTSIEARMRLLKLQRSMVSIAMPLLLVFYMTMKIARNASMIHT